MTIKTNNFVITSCAISLLAFSVVGQSKKQKTTVPPPQPANATKTNKPTQGSAGASGKVEIRRDEFSGKKTVVLRDLALSPQFRLSLSVERSDSGLLLNGKNTRALERGIEFAIARFESFDKQNKFGVFDGEYNFLADGARVHGGKVSAPSPPSIEDIRAGREILIGTFDMANLGKLIKAKTVQMKIGEKIFNLDSGTIAKLKEFYDALERVN